MRVEKSSVVNYSNQGANLPNVSIVKNMGMSQEHAGPLYDAPTAAEATPPKTAPLKLAKVKKSVATAMVLTKPGLATALLEQQKSVAFEAFTLKNHNCTKPL